MNTKIYLIADQMTSWGSGKTRAAAITDAALWLCDHESGRQGLTVEQVEAMLISTHESRNGVHGVYVIEYAAEWPDNAGLMDGDSWLSHYWANTGE